jgi:hypothetical protein
MKRTQKQYEVNGMQVHPIRERNIEYIFTANGEEYNLHRTRKIGLFSDKWLYGSIRITYNKKSEQIIQGDTSLIVQFESRIDELKNKFLSQ